jgi:hypothetical protein
MLASYAAAILVASLFHQPKEQAMPDDPVITISPMPPTEGQEVTINLIGGDDEATLTIEFVPGGTQTVKLKGGVGTVTAKRGAASMIVSGGGASATSTSITPQT